MSVDRFLELAANEEDLSKIELTVPTDIFYIRDIARSLPHAPLSGRRSLLVWIQVLLKNPFDVSNFISSGELETLKRFLLDSLKTCIDFRLKKVVKRAIALLVNSIGRGNSLGHELYSASANGFFVFGQKISEVDFYGFLKQLSKVGDIPREYVSFSDSDSIVVKRYKIKALSHSSVSHVNDLKELVSFMNLGDSRLGWTLSKSIYRMSKHVDRHSLIGDLKLLISKPIFGDEQLWINVMSLLGFFVFDGHDIGEIRSVGGSLVYDNEFVPKSTNVRETALFLHWCLLRSSFPIGDTIYTIIFVSLFDRELICRRAAASIVQEYVGRSQDDGDFRSVLGMVDKFGLEKGNLAGATDGVLQIDSSSVKRPENCLRMFCAIGQKCPYRQLVFNLLYSFNRSSRIQAAEIIARFYNPLEAPARYKTVIEMDGLHLLVLSALRVSVADQANGEASLKGDLDTFSNGVLWKQMKNIISSFVLTPQMYRLRNIREAIESYLELCEIMDPEPFKKNIMFLVAKNFTPELILGAVKPLMQDLDFSKAIFSAISKNPTGILANSQNNHLRNQCVRKFVTNLENGIYVSYTIRALSEMEAHTDDVCRVVKEFLNDYTVDMCGDSGSFNRKEALLYFLKLRSRGHSCSCVHIEGFVIRFMADKSKRLREDILRILLSSTYAKFKSDFGYISRNLENEHHLTTLILDGDCGTRIEKFFLSHAEFSKECGNEEAYFRALFASFLDSEHFYHGIINTLSASDRRLVEIITKLVYPLRDRFVDTALDLIEKNRLFVYQSLKLLLVLKNDDFVVKKIGMVEKHTLSEKEGTLLDKILCRTPE